MRARPGRSVALLLLLVTVLACAPPPTLPPPPPPVVATPPLSEEEIKPLERPNIAITDLDETASPDGKTVTVSGMLVNRGRGATREVYVHVEALNRDGAVVQFADSEPSTELIQSGSTAAFSVKLENRPDIDRYHVEAVSR
jgi:hypothetical protein